MLRKSIFILLCVGVSQIAFAQLGGQTVFQFLNAPHSAKTSTLGGTMVSSSDKYSSMVVYNPASLNEAMVKNIQFNEAFYASGIKYSSLNYVGKNSNDKLWGAGINNMSFERMDRRDASGVKDGVFYGNETAIYYTRANKVNNFTFGYNAKYAQSILEKYFAMGLYGDVGILFSHPTKEINFGLVVKNIGFQLKNYNGTSENLPFQIQSGFTFKPEHMPMRLTVSAHDLQQFDISYLDPTVEQSFFDDTTSVTPKASFGDNLVRHFSIGTEILISKNFNFRFGYNHIRRKELRLTKSGGAGISWGFLVRIKSFDVEYGKTYLQFAGRPSFISITTNTSRFKKKRSANKDLIL